MSRIEIRGIIVPSEFDGGWYEGLCDRGIITPESKFRRDLAAAPATEPLEVYLNTPGGSVFAGNEMVNAVSAWKAQTKQPVHVIVGAMAASMGAAFTIQAADSVAVHQNSLMMFHGAWGMQIGGADAMADYADLLAKINDMTKAVLLKRYKLDEDTVDEWFAEGREGWLTADEMKAAGIAHSVIGEDDEAMSFDGVDTSEFDAKGLKVAALAKGLADMKAGKVAQDDGGNITAQAGAGAPVDGGSSKEHGHGEGKGGGSETENGAQAEGEQRAALQPAQSGEAGGPAVEPPGDGAGEREAGRAEGRAEAVAEFAERVAAMEKRLADAQANERKIQAAHDRMAAEIAKERAEHQKSLNELSERLKLATDRVTKFLDGGLAFSPAPETWADALKACQGDYVKAARAYPELKRQYNEQNSRK